MPNGDQHEGCCDPMQEGPAYERLSNPSDAPDPPQAVRHHASMGGTVPSEPDVIQTSLNLMDGAMSGFADQIGRIHHLANHLCGDEPQADGAKKLMGSRIGGIGGQLQSKVETLRKLEDELRHAVERLRPFFPG